MSGLKNRNRGFTIVELLIVIVVIAILAAISVVAYTGIQERGRQAKIDSDIRAIVTAIQAARINVGTSLYQITGSTYSAAPCISKADGTDLASLPSSDPCISRYLTTLNAISNASGANLGDMRDPWGRPYLIDENESEVSPTHCTRDTVAVYKQPFTTGFDTYSTTPRNNVPNGGFTGCS